MVKKQLGQGKQAKKNSSQSLDRPFLRESRFRRKIESKRKNQKEESKYYYFNIFGDKKTNSKQKNKKLQIIIDDDNDNHDHCDCIDSQKQVNQVYSSSPQKAESKQIEDEQECENYSNMSLNRDQLKIQSQQQNNCNRERKKLDRKQKKTDQYREKQRKKSKQLTVRRQIIKNNRSYLKLLSSKICQICHEKKKDEYSQTMMCSICDDAYHRTCISQPLKIQEVKLLQAWVCPQCSKNYFIKQRTIKRVSNLDNSQEQQLSSCQHMESDQYPKDFGLYSEAMIMIAYKQHHNKRLTNLQKNFWTQRQYQWFKLQPYKPVKSESLGRQRYWIPLIRVLSQYGLFYCPFQVYKNEETLNLNISQNHLPNIVEMLSSKDQKAFQEFIQLVENGQAPPLTLDKCPYKGYLVKALQKIPPKTIICEYAGEVMTYRQSLMSSRNDSIFNLLQTGNSFTSLQIFPKKYANISKYFLGINNSELQNYNKVNVQSILFSYKGRNRIIFYTLRDVNKGQILYINYNGGISQDYPTYNFQ